MSIRPENYENAGYPSLCSFVLSAGNWTAVNRLLVKTLGITTAYFLHAIFNEHDRAAAFGDMDKNGFFECRRDFFEQEYGLARRSQEKAILELERENILECKIKGMPARRMFRLHSEVLAKILQLVQSVPSCRHETYRTAGTKRTNSTVQNVPTIQYIDNNISKKEKDKKEILSKPKALTANIDFEHLQQEQVEPEPAKTQSQKNKEKLQEFALEFEDVMKYFGKECLRNFLFTENDKKAVSTKAKAYKSIRDAGYTPEQVKQVISFKAKEWLNNPEMAKYLQPTTIFRKSKFESYFEALHASKNKTGCNPGLENNAAQAEFEALEAEIRAIELPNAQRYRFTRSSLEALCAKIKERYPALTPEKVFIAVLRFLKQEQVKIRCTSLNEVVRDFNTIIQIIQNAK